MFELARRGFEGALVGFYGFPQGLHNQNALPIPLEYLSSVRKRNVALFGTRDDSVGA